MIIEPEEYTSKIKTVNHPQEQILLTNEEKVTLFKIRKNLQKMLEDRGYNNIDLIEDNFEKFKEQINTRDDLNLFAGNDEKDEKIFAEFSNKEKIGVNQINEFGQRLFKNKVMNGIFIIKGQITSVSKQELQELSESGMHIEVFEEKDLIVNITEHELVPKHIILNKDEKQALLAKYKLKENQLPKILLTDPIAKYLGLKRAQVVKIIRPSETAGKYITYRIAV